MHRVMLQHCNSVDWHLITSLFIMILHLLITHSGSAETKTIRWHQSSAGDWGPVAGVGGRVGKSGKSGVSHGKGEGHVVHAGVNCVCNVCGSAHSCGCVVNGSFARAAF